MPRWKKMRCQEPKRKRPRKKSPQEQERKAKKTPSGEMASASSTTRDPVDLLSGPELRHPANTSLRVQAVTELQRQRGNIYVQRLIRSGAMQAKLTVNPPDDVYEREADRVATEVMGMPAPQVQQQVEPEEEEEEPIRTKVLSQGVSPLAQRQIEPEEEEEEEEPIHTKLLSQPMTPVAQRQIEPDEEEEEEPVRRERVSDGMREVSHDLESRIQSLRGGGQALDTEVRAQMESAFGADLGDVRVHTSAEAGSLAGQLGARAFTTGKDIFFGEGAHEPRSEAGRRLLAHELTHVLQQSHGEMRRGDELSQQVSRKPAEKPVPKKPEKVEPSPTEKEALLKAIVRELKGKKPKEKSQAGKAIKKSLEAALETGLGKKVKKRATELLLSRKGLPFTLLTGSAALAAMIANNTDIPSTPEIPLSENTAIKVEFEGSFRKPSKFMLIFKGRF